VLRRIQTVSGVVITLLLIIGPVAYAFHVQAQMRNFAAVQEGVLYRSGQMSLAGLKQVIFDHGIRTVISLRDAAVPGEPPPDRKEEKYCREMEIGYYRLPPREWWAPSGPAPVEDNVRKFREVLANPDNYPVLVHCFAGIHRTGAYVAIFRMEHEHWSNAEALAEMKRWGYYNLDYEADVLGYLEQYSPTWKRQDPQAEAPADKKKPRAQTRPARPATAGVLSPP
jgi:tyrosine-protein phosphatase SIW14